MRLWIAAALMSALAAPALAGTLEEATSHGIILSAPGAGAASAVEISFSPDGKLSMFSGKVTGDWRIKGDQLCTTTILDNRETCAVYPPGKTAGDSFEVTDPDGQVAVITIKN